MTGPTLVLQILIIWLPNTAGERAAGRFNLTRQGPSLICRGKRLLLAYYGARMYYKPGSSTAHIVWAWHGFQSRSSVLQLCMKIEQRIGPVPDVIRIG